MVLVFVRDSGSGQSGKRQHILLNQQGLDTTNNAITAEVLGQTNP